MLFDISVIIPVYNRSCLLSHALSSVLGQTLLPDEIIIVDDGSDDDAGSSVQRARGNASNTAAPPHIRCLRMKHCGMPGNVRNAGIFHARGKHIAFLDSDDVWLPRKLERQRPLMQRCAISHTREIWLRDGKKVSQKTQMHARDGIIFSDALRKCIIGPSTVMVRKSVFEMYGMFRSDMRIAEDYELFLRLTCRERIAYIDEPLAVKHDRKNVRQLSKEFPYIEKFRIQALKPLAESGIFTQQQQKLVHEELRRKINIWNKGAQKYNHEKQLQQHTN